MRALAGKHALITGGGSGIGAAIARTLGSEGAAISIAGRRMAMLEAVAAQIPGAKAMVADVSDE
ncbi:MAG: SDR family NAD(P)-dependent oxidoreductase, partial [Hyphomicrobiaceae bacterium]|nr:SDR family NAD(P)-dependent oxidoreductase [Hyphomicrobiaceae bacterium]